MGEGGGFNLYAYCGNDPICYYDSFGLMPCWLQNLLAGFDNIEDQLGDRIFGPDGPSDIAPLIPTQEYYQQQYDEIAAENAWWFGDANTFGVMMQGIGNGVSDAFNNFGYGTADAYYNGQSGWDWAIGIAQDVQRGSLIANLVYAPSAGVTGVAGGAASDGASVIMAEGTGIPSKSLGGTVNYGAYDPAQNTLYLGDTGHAGGMAQAGGTPLPNVTPGITVAQTPTGVVWANDSMTLGLPALTEAQAAQIQSGLENFFSESTVTRVPVVR
jgi:hypothetical protein